jgi:pilus assembly protein CpaB
MDIPPGYKVVAIKVSGDDTVAGLLRPGDRVDVIGLFKQRSRGQTQTVSRTFLKSLQVFSVGSNMRTENAKREGGNAGGAIVGVLVNEKQSEDIVYVQKTGSIKLVMRGDEATEEELAEVENILERTLGGEMASTSTSTKSSTKKKVSHEKMVVWVGNDFEEFKFEPGRRPRTAFSKDNDSAAPVMLKGESPVESNFSEDIDPESEEDQYPAL